MNTADKLMNIAIDGDPGEEVVVERDEPAAEASDDGEVVEETTVTKTVRHKPEPKGDDVVIIED